MRYIIIENEDLQTFVQLVNQQLENGYECLGGVAISNTFFYVQAMIKKQ